MRHPSVDDLLWRGSRCQEDIVSEPRGECDQISDQAALLCTALACALGSSGQAAQAPAGLQRTRRQTR